MSSNYLSAEELSDMIGCLPNSYACMRRYLKKNGWPFEPSITDFPKVSRAYHDARMSGQAGGKAEVEWEPNMAAFA